MSVKGIELTAEVLAFLQTRREELLRLGSDKPATPEGRQDILFARLLERASDEIKNDFCQITIGGDHA